MACPITATVAWAIATGVTVLSYEFSMDGEVTVLEENRIEVCFADVEGVHTLSVVTIYDLDGVPTRSEPSSNAGNLVELRLPGFEPTPTATPTATPTSVPYPLRPADAVCADFDRDGRGGFGDWGTFLAQFGSCNDGVGEVPCE